MITVDLKPCPFCGSNAGISEITMNKGPSRWVALCMDMDGKCLVRPTTGLMDTPDDAAEAWNRRAE